MLGLMPCLDWQILESRHRCRRSCGIYRCTGKGPYFGGTLQLFEQMCLLAEPLCVLCCSQSGLTPKSSRLGFNWGSNDPRTPGMFVCFLRVFAESRASWCLVC